MKHILAILALGALSTQAAFVQFELSPPGTSPGVGLSPSNEVPPAATSTGSGDVLLENGLIFDTATSNLFLAVGFGSSAGFTDLTAPATIMHLHGPAPVGSNAPILVDLGPFYFPATNPALGGIIFGVVPIPGASISNLLNGFVYLNVHTTNYPGGEIRGQLIATTNSTPVVVCPPATNIQCGASNVISAGIADADFETLTVIWSVNGTAIQSNSVPGSPQHLPYPPVLLTNSLPLGTNLVVLTVLDARTNFAQCATIITVTDTNPPVITSVTATPNTLWPPNHKLVDVTVHAVVTDTCGPTTWRITNVTGGAPSDAVITGPHTVPTPPKTAMIGVLNDRSRSNAW